MAAISAKVKIRVIYPSSETRGNQQMQTAKQQHMLRILDLQNSEAGCAAFAGL
jgi:hypothetical protein